MSLAIHVPFSDLHPVQIIEEKEGYKLLTPDITLWELKQRAYFFGQQTAHDRVQTRNAMLSAAGIIYANKDEPPKEDVFKTEQLSIGYIETKPLSKYGRERRAYLKQQREKKVK